jgi:Protein of unknown function (DUF3987)
MKKFFEITVLDGEVNGATPPPPPAEAPPLTMPDTAMIGLGRDFADLYAEYLESPRSFFFMSFLTYFGALVSRKVALDSALRTEPRLYTVLLGASADTRKSTALHMVDVFFRDARCAPNTLHGSGSAEGIAQELTENPTLLLLFDEFKAYVDKARADHSVVLPLTTTLFERGEFDNRTKEKKISIRGASLSLLAACTLDTYATMFDPRFFAIGLLNRLFLVVDQSTPRFAVPRPIPADTLDAMAERVKALYLSIDQAYLEQGLRPVPIAIDRPALALFEDWYQQRQGSIFERRLDAYAHRLMVLLTVTSGKFVVDTRVMRAVLDLVRYQLDARRYADPIDAENTVARMEEGIRRSLARGSHWERDLKRAVHVERFGLWVWETAIANLTRHGEVLTDNMTTMAGHRRPLYWLAADLSPVLSPPQKGQVEP